MRSEEMKKINVNKNSCIGCGACVAIDPEHFDFDDNGRSNVINNDNLDSTNLTNAIESCPTSAISIGEDDDNEIISDEVEECHCSNCEHNCNCDTK
jgi:ferredoxin